MDKMLCLLRFDSLDVPSTIAGGLVGLGLVYLADRLFRVGVETYWFEASPFNPGESTLYKLCFRLKGRKAPGFSCLLIEWVTADGLKSVLAKWDENPNPTLNDQVSGFQPWLVPSTYFQPLFLQPREYRVPILWARGDHREVFSGWWFDWRGRDVKIDPLTDLVAGGTHVLTDPNVPRYGPSPIVTADTKLQLTLHGGDWHWPKKQPKSFTVRQIIDESMAKAERRRRVARRWLR